MVDKVQKIRKEVKKLHGNPYYMMAVKDVLAIIDSMQLEEIPPKLPLISQKKCMYTKDRYTDEDRKVLCDGCEEECKYAQKEEPVSEDEIEKYFSAGDVVVYVSRHPAYSGLYLLGNPNDLSIGYSNANEPYQIYLRNCTIASEDERKQFMRELNLNGYKWNENTLRIEKIEKPVSEELEIAAKPYLYSNIFYDDVYAGNPTDKDCIEMFKAGANWQIKQLKRGVFIPGAKSVEFKLGEDYHISTKDFDRGKAKAYGAKEGDKIIAYFFIMDSGI